MSEHSQALAPTTVAKTQRRQELHGCVISWGCVSETNVQPSMPASKQTPGSLSSAVPTPRAKLTAITRTCLRPMLPDTDILAPEPVTNMPAAAWSCRAPAAPLQAGPALALALALDVVDCGPRAAVAQAGGAVFPHRLLHKDGRLGLHTAPCSAQRSFALTAASQLSLTASCNC
jgi:hypothetical protein